MEYKLTCRFLKTDRHSFKVIFCFVLLLFGTANGVYAHLYGEHREIGDKAMKQFYGMLPATKKGLFEQVFPQVFDTTSGVLYFKKMQQFLPGVSYGVMNGLAGDHTKHPLQLEEQLITRNSNLQRVFRLHQSYIDLGYSAAPDAKLTKLDMEYALLALNNRSHFYDYGKGLSAHMAPFDPNLVKAICSPELIDAVMPGLHKTNAINMYITFHVAAIYLAELAGKKAAVNDNSAGIYLYYAFLYNGFADHFLQDAFSAGHLLVNRAMASSVTNNKSLHDFYSRYGTRVINLRNEQWTAFGDGAFNHYHQEYRKNDSLQHVQYAENTAESERIIEAVCYSVYELFEGFERGAENREGFQHINNKIPQEHGLRMDFFLTQFKALSIIPLPYQTPIESLGEKGKLLTSAYNQINNKPYYRNFVRSRVANSVVGGFNSGLNDALFTLYSVRLNFGSIKQRYQLRADQTKRHTLDVWHKYSLSYALGTFNNQVASVSNSMSMLKGGISSNFDYWLSNKKFLGIYMINEVGILGGTDKSRLVYVPQVGLQLGSLLNINYYDMPLWLRIPVETLLPLKIHVGGLFTGSRRPLFFIGGEIHYVF